MSKKVLLNFELKKNPAVSNVLVPCVYYVGVNENLSKKKYNKSRK